MKKLLLLFILCLTTVGAWAVPARPATFTVRQPDGTEITVQLMGDEFFHYYRNVATDELLLQAPDGSFQTIDAAAFAQRSAAADALRADANARRVSRLCRNAGLQTSTTTAEGSTGPHKIGVFKGSVTGQKRGIVIMVNFSDKQFAASNTRAVYEAMFNQSGYKENNCYGSVHDYFYDQSYGLLDLTFDVFGPVQLSQPRSYYGENGENGNDRRAYEMVIEACNLADAAGADFTRYDWDGDGEVEQVYVVFAGNGENQGAGAETVWPHEFTLSGKGASLTLDGTKINTYACSCELRTFYGSTPDGIGIACHEFSHCIGFPDFYDAKHSGNSAAYGMGCLDVLSNGCYNGPLNVGEVPCGYTAYERWMAGWVEPTELTQPVVVSGMQDIASAPEAYIIRNSAVSGEYILLENRKPEGWFAYYDTRPAAGGILATHVDYDLDAWTSNNVNTDKTHQRMTIIPACGIVERYNTLSGADPIADMYFPAGATRLTTDSHSFCGGKWFTPNLYGTDDIEHDITDITLASDGTVSFVVDGGVMPEGGLLRTVSFDAGTGTFDGVSTWTWTQTDRYDAVTLPLVQPSNTALAAGWRHIGWCTMPAFETTTHVSQFYPLEATLIPRADLAFYAIYRNSVPSPTVEGEHITVYATYPCTPNLITPTVAFPATEKRMQFGESDDSFTVRVTDSTADPVYSSSNPAVATVDASTGAVHALSEGTTVITATVPEVEDVSYEATASYILTVVEPDISGIRISAPPTTIVYTEGEEFDPEGMEIRLVYTTDVERTLSASDYVWEPRGPLGVGDSLITVTHREHGTDYTATQSITICPLPRYTVAFVTPDGVCSTPTLSERDYQGGITLPAATATIEGWDFVGWAPAALDGAGDECPATYAAGSHFSPTTDVTLYAIYVRHDTLPGSGNYERVVEATDDWSGQYVICAVDPEGNRYFADGRKGGSQKDSGGIGEADRLADVSYDPAADCVLGASGDVYHLTISPLSAPFSSNSAKLGSPLKSERGGDERFFLTTQDGLFNYCLYVPSKADYNNGIQTSTSASSAAAYPIVFDFDADSGTVTMTSGKTSFCMRKAYTSSARTAYNTYFRFFKASEKNTSTQDICPLRLYRKQVVIHRTTYTSYPSKATPATIGTLVRAIDALCSGATTLDDINRIVDRILER